jgi:ribose transport system permease protein
MTITAAKEASFALPARMWAMTRNFRPVLVLVVIMFVVFSALFPAFLTSRNLTNLLTSISVVWIVSMGMTLVTIVGGFDLSVGAVAALAGFGLGTLIVAGVPAWLAILLCVAGGAVLGGLVNGMLIGRLGLSFFVVTLATTTTYTGIVNLWSGTSTINVTDPLLRWLGVAFTLGLPTPVWIMIATFLVALLVQSRTFFGRDVYAVGGSVVAARLSGIRSTGTIVAVYAIVGGCAALAGIIAVGRIGAASPQVNAELPLQAAAAVLLGGTALTGGAGGVGGTALGVLFIGMLQNGLSIAGVQSFWQQVATGVILIVAVLGNLLLGRRVSRSMLRQRRATTVPEVESPIGSAAAHTRKASNQE